MQIKVGPLAVFVITVCLIGCKKADQSVRQKTEEYFAIYSDRSDWEKLLSYYSDKLQFEDIILREKHDFKGFVEFYNWLQPGFEKHPDYPQSLILEELIIEGCYAVGMGKLTPFYWQGELWNMDGYGDFIITLEFDENLKIIKQTDWVAYPPGVLAYLGKSFASDSVAFKP
ncbi:MAG: hypothetical protein RJQ09_01945 [Cyclobacteriaceae bacterium]